MNNVKLTILGCSGALPANGRFPSAQYLSIQNRHFLIDCGEGTQFQLARFNLGIHRISHIFISHMHGDHYLGLAGLLFSMHLQRRESDLHVHSFRGLEEILLAHLRHARSVLNFRVVFHALSEAESECIFDDEMLTVETIPLDHKIPTRGFLFKEKPKSLRFDKARLHEGMEPRHIVQLKRGEDVIDAGGKILYRSSDFTLPPRRSFSYAYCSDTQPNDKYIERIKGADLLYHEATFMEEEKEKAKETRHSTAADAARAAVRGNVGKLIIGHFSARYKDLTPVLAEAQAIFPATALATEGETFELGE